MYVIAFHLHEQRTIATHRSQLRPLQIDIITFPPLWPSAAPHGQQLSDGVEYTSSAQKASFFDFTPEMQARRGDMNFLVEESAVRAFAFAPDVLNLLDLDRETWLVPLVKNEPSAHDLKTKPPQSTTAKPRTRKRPATPRLRNKAKIELLRREIASLEAELEALQQSKRTRAIQPQSRKTSSTGASSSTWKDIASRQSKERERAQLRNKGLKETISEQYMLTMSLSGVLSELKGLQYRCQPRA